LHEPGCSRAAGRQAAPAPTCAHGFVHKAYLPDLVEVKLDPPSRFALRRGRL